MSHIEQVMKYKIDGKLVESLAEAESVIIDKLGEEMESILDSVGFNGGKYRRHLVKLVEEMWKRRDALNPILASTYKPLSKCECGDYE